MTSQLLDIGLLNQLSNGQNGAYPSKHIYLREIFRKEKHLLLEKSYIDG